MMHRIFTASLSLALLAALALPVGAAGPEESPDLIVPAPLTVQVDGEAVTSQVQIMVPLAPVAQALGYQVTWDNGVVLLDNGVNHTQVTIGVDRYVITTSNPDLIGMSAPFSLGPAPYVLDGTSYVPLGLFDALLGREDAVRVEGGVISISTGGTVQIPNPFVDCGSLAEAARLAGFSLSVPEAGPHVQRTIQVVEGDMIQVLDQSGAQEICIRKAPGAGDISGDYSAYPHQETASVGGSSVTLKGDGDTVSLAVWARDGYACSIQVTAPITREAMLQLVQGVQ